MNKWMQSNIEGHTDRWTGGPASKNADKITELMRLNQLASIKPCFNLLGKSVCLHFPADGIHWQRERKRLSQSNTLAARSRQSTIARGVCRLCTLHAEWTRMQSEHSIYKLTYTHNHSYQYVKVYSRNICLDNNSETINTHYTIVNVNVVYSYITNSYMMLFTLHFRENVQHLHT